MACMVVYNADRVDNHTVSAPVPRMADFEPKKRKQTLLTPDFCAFLTKFTGLVGHRKSRQVGIAIARRPYEGGLTVPGNRTTRSNSLDI